MLYAKAGEISQIYIFITHLLVIHQKVLFDGRAANRAPFVPANPFYVLVAAQAQMVNAIGLATSVFTAASDTGTVHHFHGITLKVVPAALALAGGFDKNCVHCVETDGLQSRCYRLDDRLNKLQRELLDIFFLGKH